MPDEHDICMTLYEHARDDLQTTDRTQCRRILEQLLDYHLMSPGLRLMCSTLRACASDDFDDREIFRKASEDRWAMVRRQFPVGIAPPSAEEFLAEERSLLDDMVKSQQETAAQEFLDTFGDEEMAEIEDGLVEVDVDVVEGQEEHEVEIVEGEEACEVNVVEGEEEHDVNVAGEKEEAIVEYLAERAEDAMYEDLEVEVLTERLAEQTEKVLDEDTLLRSGQVLVLEDRTKKAKSHEAAEIS